MKVGDVYGGPTMVDGAVVAGEEGLHQGGLLFALLGPAGAGSGVHIGLHHQRFLPFLLLLLLQKSSLHGHTQYNKNNNHLRYALETVEFNNVLLILPFFLNKITMPKKYYEND